MNSLCLICPLFILASKIGDRQELYRLVAEEYNIKSALYPGSHIDISASLVISDVTYIDNFKGAIKFFNNLDNIKQYINKNKVYTEEANITFYGKDYTYPLDIKKVDLIISQYAGFVGQASKKYLKTSGILLCNDSHGDATLAYLDSDYELIGVIDSNLRIESNNLDKYFKFKKEKPIDINKVYTLMKGPKYAYQPSNYIFKIK